VVLTLLFFNSIYALTSTGRIRVEDEVLTLFQTQSLVQHGSSAVPQAVRSGLFYGRFDLNNLPRAPYPPGQALAATPWYFLSRILLHLPGAAPAADFILGFSLALSSATFAAIACIFGFLIFIELGMSPRIAFAATAMLGFATPLFTYSAWFYSEPLTCALLLAAAWLLVARNPSTEEARALLIGAILGALLWVRPTNVIFAPAFILGWWSSTPPSSRWRTSLSLCGIVALSGTLYLLRNQQLFGNPFEFGYPAVAENGRRLNSFDTPLLTGLYGFLFSPGKSIFLYAPTVILGLTALRSLWQRAKGLAIVCAATPLISLFFFARYSQWEGGYCYGPRYLVPGAELLTLPAALLLQERSRSLGSKLFFYLCAAFAVIVQLTGIATSFLETEATGRYYDAHWNYRLSFFSFAEQWRLFVHYATAPGPAPLGRGFDRWYLFLHKAGLPLSSIWIIATPELLLLALTSAMLFHRLKKEPR